MSLSAGDRLGPYEVIAAVGAGGMGEVYRARDTRLNRDVAIKVLPDAFVGDTERVARFQREAQVLASLNHPGIAQIHGVEQLNASQGSAVALVLEFVDGPTLADRIAAGPVPLDDALPIAKQIAEALDAAHERGIVHRDLKPANIKLTSDGTVKVLDFGLAKAMEEAPGSGLQASGLSMSPTITSPVMTGGGVILGTAAYMSPEQARGKAVDKRSDVWAFGCVLYEMLTGRRAFDADDVTDVLAFIITKEPDLTLLPTRTPSAVRKLLVRCLAKDRTKRLADISDARLEIEDAMANPPTDERPGTGAASMLASDRRWRLVAPGVLVCCVLTGVAVWSVVRGGGTVDRPLQRFAIQVPPSAPILGGSVAVSGDGTRLAYIAQEGGRRILYVRDLAQLEPQPIRGSEGAFQPFLSPDGEWVGFFTEAGQSSGKLKKVPVRGGPAIELCDAPGPHGGAWDVDGTIVFAAGSVQSSSGGLFRVSAAGGAPVAITKPDIKTELRHGWPNVLPNGKGIVVSILPRGGLYDSGRIAVYSPGDGSMQTIVQPGYHGRYVDSGHIVYTAPTSSALSGNLMAIPFDIDRLRATGPPVPVIEGVLLGPRTVGNVGFAVSSSGVLTYVPTSENPSSRRTLVWVDRQGREEALGAPDRPYVYPRLSPDGSRVALDIRDDQNDIWVWDLARQSLSMVTKDPGLDRFPVWSADGKRIAYASPRDGTLDSIYIQAADGTGAVQRLTETEVAHAPLTFTNDGTRLLVREGGRAAATGGVLKVLSLTDRTLIPLIQPPTPVMNAEISPDGRWLAYQSSESGRQEVYVRPFPDVNSARYPISTSGGNRPLWSRNGRELFYISGVSGDASALMAVAVQPGTSFSPGRPQKIFEGRYFGNVDTYVARSYDVSPDGRRFLMIKEQASRDQSPGSPALVLVLNLADELKRIARPQN